MSVMSEERVIQSKTCENLSLDSSEEETHKGVSQRPSHLHLDSQVHNKRESSRSFVSA